MKLKTTVLSLLLCSICHAQPELHVVTEDNPPFNYLNAQGELRGISVELAQLLFKRLDIQPEIKLLPWKEAYVTALKKPNTLIFTINHSERREDLFHWVGEVIDEDFYLYKKSSRADIQVNDLNSATQYRVGGVEQWDTTIYLTQRKVPVLELNESKVGIKLLALEKIDLMPYTELNLAYEAARYNLSPHYFRKAFKLRTVTSEFAMSLDSDPALVKKIKSEYKKIRHSEDFQRIFDKYIFTDLYDKPIAESLRLE